jgi:hypothetical protein
MGEAKNTYEILVEKPLGKCEIWGFQCGNDSSGALLGLTPCRFVV